MKNISYLKDKTFLRALDNESNKFYWVKIEVLNMEELPIESIAGKVQPGSTISIDGLRRGSRHLLQQPHWAPYVVLLPE